MNIDHELSPLWDHLSFNMERQIGLLHDELLKEIDGLIKLSQIDQANPPKPALSNLIHTITDSKLHQMNLELRQHMTTRLDVLLQDMKDEQRAFQEEIQNQLDQRLSHKEPVPGKSTLTNRWLKHPLSQPSAIWHWSNLPVWIACATLLIMLISWPT